MEDGMLIKKLKSVWIAWWSSSNLYHIGLFLPLFLSLLEALTALILDK